MRRMRTNRGPSGRTSSIRLAIVADSQPEEVREGRAIIREEAAALTALADQLDQAFSAAVETIYSCTGSIIVTGMGKAGLISQKITATLLSTGTRARFLHPADAVHGDLGCVGSGDVLLILSNSGETEEVCRLIPVFQGIPVQVIAITARESSTLGRNADIVIRLGMLKEAGHIGLAPSITTTAMLAVGDALALVVSRRKEFSPQKFALFHPGGNLGRRLTTVAQIMRKGDELRITSADLTIREAVSAQERSGRRTGALLLVDDARRLCGIFTDSDLVRVLERREDKKLDQPIREVMTRNPLTITAETTFETAIQTLSENKISEIPVVDDRGMPIGIVDITDVIGYKAESPPA